MAALLENSLVRFLVEMSRHPVSYADRVTAKLLGEISLDDLADKIGFP